MSKSHTPGRPESAVASRVVAASKARKQRHQLKHIAAAAAMFALTSVAHAELERAGPPTSVGNYPTWYQDKTGLTLEFGTPLNQNELTGGWLLILPADVPTGLAPESAFNNYSGEHFYWAAGAGSRVQGGMNLVMALEGAFASGDPVAGQQMVFGRVRVKVASVPVDGSYKAYTPFGVFDFPNKKVGDKIFHTVDVGLTPLNYSEALGSLVGPFLTPSTFPGGPEVPVFGPAGLAAGIDPYYDSLVAAGGNTPYPGTGRKYLADPARLGPLTGGMCKLTVPATLTPGACVMSNDPIVGTLTVATDLPGAVARPVYVVSGPTGPELRDTNIFRVEVDGVEVPPSDRAGTEHDFTVMGRVVETAIPGKVTVERASYSQPNATDTKLDVFALAEPSLTPRIPPQAEIITSHPELGFYDAPCGGTIAAPSAPIVPATYYQMNRAAPGSSIWWSQGTPVAIPSEVCVKDTGRAIPAYFPAPVKDEVDITSATTTPALSFNGSTFTLTVQARTSDCFAKPALLATTPGMTLGALIPQVDCAPGSLATLTVGNLMAPPSKVTVTSLRGGSVTADVRTEVGVPVLQGVVDANPDTATINEDCSATAAASCAVPVAINVLGNDLLNGAPLGITPVTVTITTPPTHGTATVDASGNVVYRPTANFNGADFVGYTVTLNGTTSVSAESYLSITVNSVNDAPVAVNDTFSAPRGTNVTLALIGNDTDPDGVGNADVSAVVIRSLPANGTLTCGGNAVAVGTVCAGGSVVFNGTATTSFTYGAVDTAGLASVNSATVSVTVAAAEVVTLARAIYTSKTQRWQIDGTSSVYSGQTFNIAYDIPAALASRPSYRPTPGAACVRMDVSPVIATVPAVVAAAGSTFAVDAVGFTGLANPTNTTNTISWCTAPRALRATSSTGAVSGALTFSTR